MFKSFVMQVENGGIMVPNLVLDYYSAKLASIMHRWNQEGKE